MTNETSGKTTQKTEAAREWTAMVEAEHAQTDRLREAMPQRDHWRGRAKEFRVHRRRREKDPAIDAALEYIRPDDVVIDVGAGGGRMAIPLAQACRELIAVEPSEAMREQMATQMKEAGVSNITVVPSTWQEAAVEPADVVFCSHVMYAVHDPEPFVFKMIEKAKRRVLVVLFHRPVPPNMHPLWEPVHGEKRLQLPAMTQFERMVNELGIEYDKKMLPERDDRTYENLDAAIERAMRHLYVVPGTEKYDRLVRALEEGLVETPNGLQLRWAAPMTPGVITWATGS